MFFSKKKNKVESDFDLDDELDFGDFDFPDPDVKDDRKPIVKVTSGAVTGAVEKVKDTAFLKQTLKDSLPDSFGESMDIADKVKESVKDLYDESAKEIKPAIKEGKRLVGKLIPKESKLVPKAVYSLLARWKEEEEAEKRGSVLSKEAQQEAMLSSQLADIFKIQTEMAVEKSAKQEGHDRLQEGIALTRHNELADYARMTAVSVDKLQKYEQSITLGYQKKSLELQFRQLFMLQDTLQYAKEDSAKRDNILTAISKNTTLPEAVKIKNTEIAGLTAKNKFSETIYRSLFGGRDNMVEDILTGMRKRVIEQVKGAVGAFNMGSDAVGQMQDMKESMNLDSFTEAGKMAGGAGVGWLGAKLGGGIRNKIEEGKLGKPGQWIMDKAKKLTYFNENIAQKANTFRTKDHDDGTFLGTLKTFFQDFIPNMRPDLGVDVQTSKDITSQQVYTRRTEKSITEIIPGYLSRILREVQVLRTGNEKIELTQYDLDKNKFTSKGKLDAKLLPKTISQSSAKWTNRNLDSMLKKIDPSGKALSPEAQTALKKKLLTSSSMNREGNEDFLASDRRYGEMDPKLRDEILPVMQKFFEGLDQDGRNEFTSHYNSLAGTVASPQHAIQNEINLGNINQLRKMGLVKKDSDQIDMDKVFDYILSTKEQAAKPASTSSKFKPANNADQTLSDRDAFIGPRQPRAPLGKQLKESAERLKKRLLDEVTPEAMEKKGQTLRKKYDSAINAANDQINNPDSAANSLVTRAGKAASSLRTRARNAKERVVSGVKEARKKTSELMQSPDPGQTLADKFKGSTEPLSSFFKGLKSTQGESDEQETNEAPLVTTSTLVTPSATSTLAQTQPLLGKKNKSKAKAQAKAQAKAKKRNKPSAFNPALTPVASAINALNAHTEFPTSTLPEVAPVSQEETSPLNKAGKRIRGILGDLRQAIKDPKALAQMAKAQAQAAASKLNEVTGGAPAGDAQTTQPMSVKDSPVELLKKMGKKVRTGIAQIKDSPQLEQISNAVSEKAKGAVSALDTATGSDAQDKTLSQPMSFKDKPLDLLKKFGKRGRTNLQKLKESDVVTSVTNKAKAAMQAVDQAAGGAPVDDTEQAATALSREDTAAQIFNKLKKKGEMRLERLRKKPGVQELEDKVTSIKDKITQSAKTVSERSAKENVNAVLSQVNTVVDDLKSGKTKDAVIDKAKQAKDELIKPNLEKILGRLKPAGGLKTDVFVAGEQLPRLTALKMQEGHYFDVTTNRVIKEYADIKGPVIDTANNDSVVIEKKDLANLTRIDPSTKVPIKLDLKNFKFSDPKELAAKAAQMGFAKVKELVFTNKDFPLDVFVEGIAEPVLTGAGMMRSEYFDKETGDPIRHETEINGPVVNAEGRELVTAEQLPLLRIWIRENKRFERIKYVGNLLAKIGKGLWHYQTKVAPKWAMFNLRMLKKAAVFTGKLLTGNLKDGVKDVYVKGESKPRLYAARIKAGDYFDYNNGSIINHQDDIRGPVADRDNTIVIREEDLDRLQVYDSILKIFNPFRLAAKAMRFLAKSAKATVKGAAKAAWWAMKKGASLAGKALNLLGRGAVRLFQKAQDVFVMGEAKPRLSAIRMKEGEYFSKKTGKAILFPADIDGPVVDKNNEPVLDDDHIKIGLVDEAGKPIKSKALQFLGSALGVINKALSLRVKLKTTRNGMVSKALMKNPAATAADKSVALLSEIKESIDRMMQPKKNILGDTDGDGDRENSSQDKREKREKEKKKDKAPGAVVPENKEKKSGWLSMLLPAIGGLISKISGLTSVFGILKTVLGLIPGVGSVMRVAGAVAGSSVGKAAIGLAGKGAMSLGKGALGLAARALPALGSLAGASASAAGIGSTVAGVGAGLLTFLSSPVVLGVAATAALGYGGYSLYKYIKNSLSPFEKLRYVQYGFPRGDQQYASKVMELEKYVKGFVRDGDKGLTVVEADMDVKNLMSPWGMDPTNEDQMTTFFKWYQERFKPVYLTHLTAIKAVTQKQDLAQADKLKGEPLKKYLDSAKFSDGPYHVTALPLEKPDFKASSASDVRAVVDELMTELAEDKKKQITASQLKAPAASTDSTATPAAQTPLKSFNSVSPEKSSEVMPAGTVSVLSSVNSSVASTGNRAGALDAVRFKAYGLTEMDAAKVTSIRMLEREVSKGVAFDSKSAASWKGNPIALLENIAGSFGIGELYGKESNDWSIWFTERFLVVYMAYLSAMRTYTGRVEVNPSPDAISSEQQLQLAKLLIGLKGIWSVKASPWPNFMLANSSDITKENINLLDDVAKVTQLQEDKKAADNKNSTKDNAQKEQPKDALKPPSTPDKNLSDQYGAPDAEVKANAGSMGVAPASAGMSSLGNIAIAGGEMVDGRNAQAYLNFGKGVDLSKMNPQLLKQFYGMAEEYGKLTGKKIGVNDAFRSYEDQVAMKKKYGPRAAEPGNSLHEFGLAMDVDSAVLNEMDKMGLMRKYGFTRPVGGEPWHMEPAGIQSDISGFKRNSSDAMHAIEGGIGRGGGGLGTVAGAPQYARNRELAMKLFAAAPGKAIDASSEAQTLTAQKAPEAAGGKSMLSSMASTVSGWFGSDNKPAASAPVASGASAGGAAGVDQEATPKTGIIDRVKSAFGFGSSVSTPANNLPADPSVKVPDAKGSGFGAVKDTIAAAAKMVGVDPGILFKTAAVESGFNPSAKAGTSSASGLFQFTKGTWDEMVTKYGAKYGYTPGNVSPFDPKVSAIMGAHYIKDSMAALGKRIGRAVGATETYMAHFLGPAGAGKFLSAMDKSPQTPAAQVMPEAAASNKPIFYENGRPRTMTEVYSVLDKKVANQARAHGVPAALTGPATTAPAPANDMPSGSTYTSPHIPSVAGNNKSPNITPVSLNTTPAGNNSVSSALTNQSNSPLTDAYGFKPMQSAASLAPQGQANQLSKEMFSTTENLLGQSVEIQKKILEVMSNIFGVMSANKPEALGEMPKVPEPKNTTTNRFNENYTVPKVPVSMARSRLST